MTLPPGFFRSGGKVVNEDGVELLWVESATTAQTDFTYNANGDLESYVENGVTWTLAYDGSGNLTSVTGA